MKHPMFAAMGENYPIHLETEFERILIRIEKLWHTSEIHDYFSDLLIDKRGGRKGFPALVMQDIINLREHHELETFQAAERKEDAERQLERRGIVLDNLSFLEHFRAGHQDVIDLYVRAQFRFPASDDGEPIVLAALRRNHTVIARIVINAGADVNQRNRLGLTPLLVACGKTTTGFRSIAESLIARGAHVNVRDPMGNTPLLLAISGGMFDIARLLLEHGANDRLSNGRGESALDLLQRSNVAGAGEMLDFLLSRRGDSAAAGSPPVADAIRQQTAQSLAP